MVGLSEGLLLLFEERLCLLELLELRFDLICLSLAAFFSRRSRSLRCVLLLSAKMERGLIWV